VIPKLIQMTIVRKFIVCPLSAAIMGLWPRPGKPPPDGRLPLPIAGQAVILNRHWMVSVATGRFR
jgi:hypothetical protein